MHLGVLSIFCGMQYLLIRVSVSIVHIHIMNLSSHFDCTDFKYPIFLFILGFDYFMALLEVLDASGFSRYVFSFTFLQCVLTSLISVSLLVIIYFFEISFRFFCFPLCLGHLKSILGCFHIIRCNASCVGSKNFVLLKLYLITITMELILSHVLQTFHTDITNKNYTCFSSCTIFPFIHSEMYGYVDTICPIIRLYTIRKRPEWDRFFISKTKEIIINISILHLIMSGKFLSIFWNLNCQHSVDLWEAVVFLFFKLVSFHCVRLSLKASSLFACWKMTDRKKRNNEINGELQDTLAIK